MRVDPRGQIRRSVRQASQSLRRAFAEQHSTERVARSFSLGLFVAMLPTVGIGPVLLLALSGIVERVNRLAAVASVLVCNPLLKPVVYALGLGVGFVLLGPVDGVSLSVDSLAVAPDVLVRLVVGNVVLAAVVAVVGYAVAFRTVDQYRARNAGIGPRRE